MVTALYRRYRPETFGEMIGQSQVTEPLMTALRTNRVNHAYLFSGPRGCGKTTSARILARCLNCAEGPTDTPCGVCPSCVELARDGSGSLDVVEIDAASHNGVDDARDLRERAVFAPARDRYKIFILDEAHMVTPQGFNALLKIVEEPPEHIKFIFATTEPDKVIGTIRSRTHHYPFRLIPPAQLLEYVQALCEIEGVAVAPGVLPLVVRAGGGSARDTLSLLDQLIAGSESNRIEYERAVALLGYTHASLLGEVIDALGNHDSAAAFGAVDRVIQTGQDPRRFVEDLLERLRDVIIVAASRSAEGAAAVLRGMPSDDILQMQQQAGLFGAAELSRTADIVNAALTEMTGATSPRLHLELMIARVLVPASDDTARGALARVERLERRVGVSDGSDAPARGSVTAGGAAQVAPTPSPSPSPSPTVDARPPLTSSTPAETSNAPAAALPVTRVAEPVSGVPSTRVAQPVSGVPSAPAFASVPGSAPAPGSASAQKSTVEVAAGPASSADAAAAARADSAGDAEAANRAEGGGDSASVGASDGSRASTGRTPATTQLLKDAWPEILEAVEKARRSAWLVVYTASVRGLEGDVLTLSFPSENDVASFKQQQTPGQGVSEVLRQAIVDIIGVRVKFIARVDSSGGAPAAQPAVASAPVAAPSVVAPPVASPPVAAPKAPRPVTGQPVTGRPTASRTVPRQAEAAPAAGGSTTSWPTVAIPMSAPEPGDEPVRAGVIAAGIPLQSDAAHGSAERGVADRGATAQASAERGATAQGMAERGVAERGGVAPAGAEQIPEDIPESPIAEYDEGAGWYVPGDDIPLGDGPTDVDPSDFLPVGPRGVGAQTLATAETSGRASGGPVWLDTSSNGESAAPAEPFTSSRPESAAAAAIAAPPAAPARAEMAQPGAAATTPNAAPAPRDRAPQRAERATPDRPMPRFGEKQRYGEAVVREILGASFIEERPVAPRPAPGAGPGREG
ncbi:DNA polymerase III subunit gamma and tau [Subtercola lobariae]|uniref:DNA-directed DNA polymerase n=1 Tax=Subtercola lobariae TaxID=1588641 RepID=A0A917B151_9MICO|nr:DNA polymerase III subunit gamma and tau [Subtercola lobariae]GGF12510.1 hypothetical protein GCM10011399_03080 [Subtercola lobariae]